MMRLSVIVPVYNAEKYIGECLDSLSICPMEDAEFLLIDDGSTDKGPAICKQKCEQDHRFRMMQQENLGVSRARNTGLKAATGDYVMFLDADDYLKVKAWDCIEQNIRENFDFVAFSYDTLYENLSSHPEILPVCGENVPRESILELVYADSCMNPCWGKLFQREIIVSKGILFDEDLPIGEDYKFVAEYIPFCEKINLSEESILFYRQHGTSAMRRYSVEKRLEFTKRLYDFQRKMVGQFAVGGLEQKMQVYYFKVLTNLCREFVRGGSLREGTENMRVIADSSVTREIMERVNVQSLPAFKKWEAMLLRQKRFRCMTIYFWVKGKL
jgi:glycosyltransferase involved in cell wall biosynthesis